MITPIVTYSNYYKFKAKAIFVGSSQNRIGLDPWPRFHLQPTELIEVMAYSSKPQSTDDGYIRDKESGLYLKDRLDLSEDDILTQFQLIQLEPPYGFNSAESYSTFIRVTMEAQHSAEVESMYVNSGNPKIDVKADDDPDMGVDYTYTECKKWIVRTFQRTTVKPWPVEKGITVFKRSNNTT